jgi:uncharacterized protein YyaL (SSP411 family)
LRSDMRLPGAEPFDPDTRAALAAVSPGDQPYTNRLILETSPYLRQHAHNPVDWMPWGDAAFARARQEKKPVLLSIGYSTCHWCHVMAHESFESEAIATVMNTHYICVKVDREERPDVDAIYMTAVQLMSGHGGWPMTVWLTPDREPFYAATYLPPVDGARGVRMGFQTVLLQLRELFDTDPERVASAALELSTAIRESMGGAKGGDVPPAVLDSALKGAEQRFDPHEGGFRGAPKFPSSLPVRLLLRLHERTGAESAAQMARLTLDKMAAGGLYDHLAGGFHRYSTDAYWLVPHFEKMLYDNALLASAYTEAHTLFGRGEAVCRDILRYVLRDMTSGEGTFFSATDADSLTPSGHKDEGYFFTWTQQEVKAALGAKAEAFCRAYGVSAEGNFEGRSVLSVLHDSDFAEARAALLAVRNQRPAPGRDDKVITAWNGLMISALAKAGFAFADTEYVRAATRAAEWLFAERFADGFSRVKRGGPGFLDDQANMLGACVDLFLATSAPIWITRAKRVAQVLETRFLDAEHGGFFTTPSGGETLLARDKPSYDGAEPSGNSVAAYNLLRLARVTSDASYETLARRTIDAFARVVEKAPHAMSDLLLAVDLLQRPQVEVAIVGDDGSLVDALRRAFLPGVVWAFAQEAASEAPFMRDRPAVNGKPSAYVCTNMSCNLPVHSAAELLAALRINAPHANDV